MDYQFKSKQVFKVVADENSSNSLICVEYENGCQELILECPDLTVAKKLVEFLEEHSVKYCDRDRYNGW